MIKKIGFFIFLLGVAMSVQAETYVVDVRTPAELQEVGKVEGALNADFCAPDFVEQFKALKIDPSAEVDLYCRSGVRAGKAKVLLESLGYKNVKNLGGYEQAAAELKRPLVK